MKTFTALIALAAGAVAQNAFIGLPTKGAELKKGSEVTVQVTRPNSLTGSTELAVAIGIQSCQERCFSVDSVLGTVLYHGPFKPEYHPGTSASGSPYENFTVTIPDTLPAGPGLIGVAHAALVGAGAWPFLETLNQTITIV